MHTGNLVESKFCKWLAIVLVAAMLAISLPIATAQPVSAGPGLGVSITAATGGTGISIDTTSAAGGTGAWTTLTGPVITESVVGDISEGVHELVLPAGWEFNTAQGGVTIFLGTVEGDPGTDFTLGTTTITPNTTTLSFNVTDASTTGRARLNFSGIQVRPSGIVVGSGNITHSGSAIVTVTNGVTSFGALSTVNGAATKYVILNPVDGTVDAAITVTVQLQDQFGNVVTTGDDKDKDVTLNADGAATGDGVVNIANGAGTMNISDQTPETVNLTLADSAATGFDVTSTQDVVFAPGAATHLHVTGITDPVVAGTASGVVITAHDQYDNVATAYAGTTHLTSSDAQAVLAGDYTFVPADNGTHTIANGVTLKTAGEKTVTATDTVNAGINGTQADITVTHAAASKYVILNPADGTTDAVIAVTVQLQDAFGNLVTTGGDKDTDVTLNADGSATGDGVVDIVNGTGSLNLDDTVAETVTLTLTDSAVTGFDITSTQDVIFGHGAANKYVILNPEDGTVDAPITVTVQLQDADGNIINSGALKDTDVTLDADGAATGDGVVNITDGVGTLEITDHTAQTVNLSLTDSAGTTLNVASTQNVIFAPGVITKLAVTGIADPVIAGTASDIVITAQDQYGNTNTTYAGTIHLTSSDAQAVLAGDYTFVPADNGTHTIANGVTLKTAGEQIVTATDTVNAGLTGTQNAITVTHAAASKYVILNPTDGTVDANITVTVQLQDAYGNLVTTGADKDTDVTLNADGAATGDGVVDISNGVGSLAISDQTAETVNLSLANVPASAFDKSSTQDVVFAHGVVTKVLVETAADGSGTVVPLGNLTAGTSLTVYSISRDQYDNFIANVAADSWSFSATFGGVVNGDLVVAGDGMSATMTGHLVGTATIHAAKEGLASTDSGVITVVPAAPHHLAVVTSGNAATLTMTAGEQKNIYVVVYDQFGNLCDYDAAVDVTLSGPGSVGGNIPEISGADLPHTYPAISFVNGILAFENAQGLVAYKAETVNLHAVAGALNSTGYDLAITVNPAALDHFTVTGITDPVVAGTPSNVTVTAYDAYGNVKTDYLGTIHFTSTDVKGTTVLPADYTFLVADAGTKAFTNGVTLTTAGEQTVTATDAGGEVTGNQADITVTPAAIHHFTVAGITDPVVAGTPSDVTVTSYDVYENVKTDYLGTIHFTSTDVKVSTILPGDYTYQVADAGAKTFANGVTLTTAGEQTVTATVAGGGATGSQTAITVTPAAANHISLSATPATLNAGDSSTLTASVEDQYSNIRTGDNTSWVTFTAEGNAAWNPHSKQVTAGVATSTLTDAVAETVRVSVTANPWIIPDEITVTFNGVVVTIDNPSAGAVVTGTVDVNSTGGTDYQIDGGAWVATNVDWNTNAVPNGSHTIRAKATASGITYYSDTITVVVNNGNVPTFGWTSPEPGDTIAFTQTVDAVWTVGGDYDNGSVEFSINGKAWAGADTNTTEADIPVQVGTNTLQVRATKTLGGVVYYGYSAINTFTVSSTPVPTITITAPEASEVVSGSIIISFNVNNNVAADAGTAKLSIDGGAAFSADITWDAVNSNYIYTWDTTNVSDGVHSIRAEAAVDGITGYSNIILVEVNNQETGAPTITGVYPAGNNDGEGYSVGVWPYVQFSEAMDPVTIDSNSVKLVDADENQISANVTMAEGNTRAIIVPASVLDFDTVYHIHVTTTVTDANGNPMAAEYDGAAAETAFTTVAADEIAPEIWDDETTESYLDGIYPYDTQEGVSINIHPYIRFTEPMDVATLNSNSIWLAEESYITPAVMGGDIYEKIDCTIVPGEGFQTAQIIPVEPLYNDSNYHIYVMSKLVNNADNSIVVPIITDAAGNALNVVVDAAHILDANYWYDLDEDGIVDEGESFTAYGYESEFTTATILPLFVEAYNITDTSADIFCEAWDITAEQAIVLYSPTSTLLPYGVDAEIVNYDGESGGWDCQLTNLVPATTYYYRIVLVDNFAYESLSAKYISETFSFTTAPGSTGILVESIQPVKTLATIGGGYKQGWEYKFNITVNDMSETQLKMLFGNWIKNGATTSNDTNTISASGNMLISLTELFPEVIEAGYVDGIAVGNTYDDQLEALDISGIDNNPDAGGRQISIYVYVKIPSTITAGGSFSTSYGIQTLPVPEVNIVSPVDDAEVMDSQTIVFTVNGDEQADIADDVDQAWVSIDNGEWQTATWNAEGADYTYDWDITGYESGSSHTIQTKAVVNGVTGYSDAIDVTVALP